MIYTNLFYTDGSIGFIRTLNSNLDVLMESLLKRAVY